MPARHHPVVADERQSGVTEPAPTDDSSASGPVQHHVRTSAGPVSLRWDPGRGVFVAERGQQNWSDARLGDLARAVGMKVPASVARDLRRDERLHPGPSLHIRRAHTPSAVRQAQPNGQPPRSVPPADPPSWPPTGAHLVSSLHGQVAIAWEPQDQCFTAVTASGDRWRAEHLDDLAIEAGASIPRAYVEELLRDAGRPVPTWDAPPVEAGNEWAELQTEPVAVPALLDGLPPGLAGELKPVLAAPSPTEPGGVARVETARRAVRAEWGTWVIEAGARCQLLEDLDSVMQGLARGELLHQTVQRLERLADRYGRRVDIERSPTIGAHMRASKSATPPTPTTAPMDRLHALRSRPASPTAAVERT